MAKSVLLEAKSLLPQVEVTRSSLEVAAAKDSQEQKRGNLRSGREVSTEVKGEEISVFNS